MSLDPDSPMTPTKFVSLVFLSGLLLTSGQVSDGLEKQNILSLTFVITN